MTGTWILWLSIQLGIIIPTDFHIFQRGRYITNQVLAIWLIGVTNLILFFFASPPIFLWSNRNMMQPIGDATGRWLRRKMSQKPSKIRGFRPRVPHIFRMAWDERWGMGFRYISHPFSSSLRSSNWTRRLQICWQKCRRLFFWVAKKASFVKRPIFADLGKNSHGWHRRVPKPWVLLHQFSWESDPKS